MAFRILPPPSPIDSDLQNVSRESDDEDADTASQLSIPLSSPPRSRRNSTASHDPRESFVSSGSSNRDSSSLRDDVGRHLVESPLTSVSPTSIFDAPKEFKSPTYPPTPPRDDTMSISSFASTSSRKARPESLIIATTNDPLVLGVALVDFNHLVGPRIEYSRGEIFEDAELAKILPFLALPDGAHLSAEDYSYFHLVKSGPPPTTVFGISCNQQIAASSLLVKGSDVTRSTVQKAVVVLAAKPVFGPIRDKLRVVTSALFLQRDFSDASILDDFEASLERTLRGQLTESGFYMGTSLRELVHTFRQRTLVLVKALMLQKRIMFFGYPVEKLCTYQYSLVALLPGLLQTLDDCGSPPLAARAPTLTRPTSLRTSDHKSMMAFMGLPLDIFGKNSFFQPYLPLQQIDMIKGTPSWLCGCTNSIITQQQGIDLLVNTDTGVFEFRDQRLERSAGLTAADRKWMDNIVTDVNESWDEKVSTRPAGMQQFKGSDDYLRAKFEEYITAALASVKYRDFISKGENSGVLIAGGTGGHPSSIEDFNPLWISEFKRTNAYEVWERITDPVLFDIIEPRHPCNEKPSVVSDIGLRLQEGIQELKLEQQLAPAREAVARTFTVGSSNFFKAVEGVKGRWSQRIPSHDDSVDPQNKTPRTSTPPIEVSKTDWEEEDCYTVTPAAPGKKPLRPFSLTSTNSLLLVSPTDTSFKPPNTSWGSSIGSFLSARALKFQLTPSNTPTTARPSDASNRSYVAPTIHEQFGEAEGSPLFNVAATPETSPSAAVAPASIDAVLNAGASTHPVEVPSNENGVVIVTQHDGPGDSR